MSSTAKGSFELSAKRRALLEALLSEQGINPPVTDTIPRREDSGPAPLSFAQQRLWFFDQFEPGNPAYNVMGAILLQGKLDTIALERSFSEIIRRHETLRTTFAAREGELVQIIAPPKPFHLQVVDITEPELQPLIHQQTQLPFDLRHGPLLRITLVRLKENEHVLLLAMHHIVSDAWSMDVLVGEFVALYEGYVAGREVTLPTLPIQYADFATWQRQWLQGDVLEKQFAYWRQQLGGSLPILELASDRPRPPHQTYNGTSLTFSLSPALAQSLHSLCKAEGVTLFMTLLAAFKVLLYRYTGQEDLIVGSPIANRHHRQLEGLIGFFVNTLPLRTDLSGNPTFRELLERVRETAFGAYAHQDLPFEYLVERLHPNRDLTHSPLVQVVFVLQNTPYRKLELPGLIVTPLKCEIETAKFDLTVFIDEQDSEFQVTVEYNTDLFDRDTIERMVQHLRTLLEGIVGDPSARISELPILTGTETHELLEWNDTRAEYQQDVCAHQVFEAQVERTPNAVAVAFEDERLSYGELNARSNKLAHHLRALGVGAGDVVGIFMERSLEMIVGILGTLKAGAACLPLDPSNPLERLEFMLSDAGDPVVLSQRRLAAALPETGARVVCVDADWDDIERNTDDNPRASVTPESWIYVIYTSGSTGTPKAVCMPHRALVNIVDWHLAAATKSARTLQFASLNFDISFEEIFSTFAAGACLVLVRDSVRVDMPALGRLIEENRIERFHLPVVVLQKLAENFSDKPQTLSSLRELMVGGEQLQITPELIKLFTRLKDCTLYNHYGPSETHVVTAFKLPDDPETWPVFPPLGRPIANTEMYVLDSHLHPVPIGVAGELYIGGACLAHGYLNRPVLTAARFLPNPFSREPGARFYKTGDLVRYRKDSNIEFIGRNDFQVKIRGMRIELGEIEMTLRLHESVRDAVVTLRQDEKKLVAYVTAKSGCTIEARQLREHLRGKLPDYMLPSAFVSLPAFPLTTSGKIDRLALPAPEKNLETEESFVAPRGAVEEVLATIFAEVLNLERVGVHDSFFELGGHSLSATQIVSRTRETFGVELPVRKIFEQPTVEGLAQALVEEQRERIELTAMLLLQVSSFSDEEVGRKVDHRVEKVSPQTPSREAIRTAPLSFAQHRLWFLDQYEPNNILYNIPSAIRLRGPLDVTALERSLNEILKRHEALRTTFILIDSDPVQLINKAQDFRLSVIEIKGPSSEDKVAQLTAEEAQRPFNLAEGPLLRVKLLQLTPDDHVLLLTMHHIISDGWSIKVLIHELGELYEAHRNEREAVLPDLPIQYADFAAWQREWLQGGKLEGQLSYWKAQLADAPPLLELPTDRPRPTFTTFHGADVYLSFSKELSDDIVRLSRHEGATLFMTLMSAFSVLLYRYSGQHNILVGTPIANRNRTETESLIGFFINTLILRMRFTEQMTFRELMGQVRETALDAYAHQDLPFEKLVEELHPERTLSHTPIFQVVFHLQNALTEGLSLSGLSMSMLEVESQTAKFDLLLTMTESEDGLTGTLNYNTDLFDAATIKRMAEHFENLLEAAVSNADEQVSRLPLLTETEKNRILPEWNDTHRNLRESRPIHLAFAEQARRTPEALAVSFEQSELTYRELNSRANQLAHRLRRLGVGPEVPVGLLMRRSAELVVAMLGVLKAGGAYVPLDPDYPHERLAFMLDVSQSPVLVIHGVNADALAGDGVGRLLLDIADTTINSESDVDPVNSTDPENPAYIIFTSGSTGTPKGIVIPHRAVNHLVAGGYVDLRSSNRVAQASNASFDAMTFEVWSALLSGAQLIGLPLDVILSPRDFAAEIRRRRVDTLFLTTALFNQIARELPEAFAPLEHLLFGGEAADPSAVRQVLEKGRPRRLVHVYGPTETTTFSSWKLVHEVPATATTVSIGRALSNTRLYVLDHHLHPVPIGVTGELYIGGNGLARGYLNDPELTAERFIPDPFDGEPCARLYKTGDLTRWLADRQIEFVRRNDFQIKMRGFRIEPGEIETVLREHECVREAVVVERTDARGDTYLTAYVVAHGPTPTAGELRAFLKEKLPEYMLPSVYLLLDKLPLTPHGKVDRRALPQPERGAQRLDVPFVAARNAIEEVLSEIFVEVLRVERVGVHDSFFDLGGHSLLATQIVSRVRKTFQSELPLRKLFEAPTIASLATVLVAGESSPGQLEKRAETLRRTESLSEDDLEELLRRKRAKAAS